MGASGQEIGSMGAAGRRCGGPSAGEGQQLGPQPPPGAAHSCRKRHFWGQRAPGRNSRAAFVARPWLGHGTAAAAMGSEALDAPVGLGKASQ